MEYEKRLERKRLILFLTFAIVIGWFVFLLVPFLGLTYGSSLSIIIVMVAMFVPTLANLLTRWITKEGFGNMYLRPRFKGHLKHYLLIYFGPTVLILLSGVVYFLIFPGSFDPNFTVIKQITASTGIPATTYLIISILQMAIIGPIINIIPTLGEELGWRGYLLPKLRGFFPDWAALIITGAIWGIWHIPVIVMGHNYGTGYAGYPWLGILAMIVFCIVLGFIEGYASIKLQSAIPAAMIHSTVNAGAALPIYLATPGFNPVIGPAMTGFVGILPFTIIAAILLIRISSQKTNINNNKMEVNSINN